MDTLLIFQKYSYNKYLLPAFPGLTVCLAKQQHSGGIPSLDKWARESGRNPLPGQTGTLHDSHACPALSVEIDGLQCCGVACRLERATSTEHMDTLLIFQKYSYNKYLLTVFPGLTVCLAKLQHSGGIPSLDKWARESGYRP